MMPHSPVAAALLVSAAGLAFPASAASDPPVRQAAVLLAPDGFTSDNFGQSVAVHGDRLVVGAHRAAFAGTRRGAAYQFDVSVPDSPDFVRVIAAPDGQRDDLFGATVDVGDSYIAVGAHLAGPAGKAYLFDAETGDPMHTLEPPPGTASNASFGVSVATGQQTIVGARYDNTQAASAGAAFVFDSAGGTIDRAVFPLQPTAGGEFGLSVDADDDLFVASAFREGDLGAVYIMLTATGDELHRLRPASIGSGDQFGLAVAMSDGIVAAGAPRHALAAEDAGAVFLFDAETGAELSVVTAPDSSERDQFGRQVALHGDTLVVGASIARNSRGIAYVFDVSDPASPSHLATLAPPELVPGDRFGVSVAVHNDLIAVGARGSSLLDEEAGAAYLFERVRSLPCGPSDLAQPYGQIDLLDADAFIDAFILQDALADIAPNLGVLDVSDIDAFLIAFASGCP